MSRAQEQAHSTAPQRADPLRPYAQVALGIAAGLLICASLPPWGWWPLAFIGVALWCHVLVGSPGRRFLVSWAVGLGWFLPSTLWIWGLTAPGYIVGGILGWGTLVGLIGLSAPSGRLRLVTLPAGIIVFEWFHSLAPFGGVPISMLSMSQARGPLLPAARLGGGLLVSGAVAAIGCALYVVISERKWRWPLAVVLICASVVVGGWASGFLIGPAKPDGPVMRIAAVQGGGPQGTTFSYEEIPRVFQRHLEATRRIEGPVDLVIWPENTVYMTEGTFSDSIWRQQIATESRRLDSPIMVGVVEDDPDDPKAFLNYVVIVRPDGTLGDRFDKERRVPFGEYVPLRPLFEPFARGLLPPRDATPGEGSAMVETRVGPTAVVISWEVFFPRRVREGVRAGGQVVLNPTNGASFWMTQIQSQQIATSTFRAVESGRWLVQVAPTGFSAVIDDNGAVHQRTGIGEQRVLYADVPMLSGTTPAQLLGELPAMTIALVAYALVLLRRRRGAI